MHSRPLIREKKYPRHRRFEDGGGVLAFQFDIADFGIFRRRPWPQRRPSRFKGQRHQLVLLIEGINQTAIGRSRRQEFLGSSGSRCGEGGSKYDSDGEIVLDVTQVARSSDKGPKGGHEIAATVRSWMTIPRSFNRGPKGRHTLATHNQGSREARQPWA